MKLCKDCKWFDAGTEECHHKSAVIRDYVYGKDRCHLANVHRAYKSENDCTPDARFFEESVAHNPFRDSRQ